MVEKAERSRVGDEPRGDPDPEWELFVRDDADDPLQHVGSVRAPNADAAHREATRLFAWYADDLWVCPASEVRRYSVHSLAESDTAESDGDGGRRPDGDDAAIPEDGIEPRTHEL